MAGSGSGSSSYGSGGAGKGNYSEGYSRIAGYGLSHAGSCGEMRKGYGKGFASVPSGYNNKIDALVRSRNYLDVLMSSYLKAINSYRITDKESLDTVKELRKINANYFDRILNLEERLEICPGCGRTLGKCSCRN